MPGKKVLKEGLPKRDRAALGDKSAQLLYNVLPFYWYWLLETWLGALEC